MGRSVVSEGDGAPHLACMPVHAPAGDTQHPAHTIHTAAFELNGLRTDLLLQSFSDRVFIVVTQMKKLGTILTVSRDVALGGGACFSTDTLSGRRDEPVLDLIARRVASSMADAGLEKPLLIALALRSHDKSVAKPILDAIDANKVW